MRSSPDARRAALLSGSVVGVVALGLLAEADRYDWTETRDWLPDLLVGWTLAGLGLAAFALARPRGAASLLILSGVTWFLGNFYAAQPEWLASACHYLSWVFLAPLVHLSLAYPTGRPRTRLAAAGVAAAWTAVVLPGLDRSDDWSRASVLAAFSGLAVIEWLRAHGPARRDAGHGVVALGCLFASALLMTRLRTLGAWNAEAIALEAGVVIAGVWLFAGLHSPAALTERAIELDESTSSLRDALAELLGDPALRIGYALVQGQAFADDEGRTVPSSVPGLVATQVDDATGVVAVVIHDPAVLTREEDRGAVSVAIRLAAERARLRDGVRRRADEIAASTLRLVRAGDDARVRLAARLESGPGARLAEAGRLVSAARATAARKGELGTALERSSQQVARAEAELEAFAAGLDVPALAAGLPRAVAELVDGLPLAIETHVDDLECAPEIAATIWFICSEGVANVLKHAGASRLVVEVTQAVDEIRVSVEDDGHGGADPTGSGLAGLRDRVSVVGGRLHVTSTDSEGTQLVAELQRGLA
jgi:signal transduction histidine kinase